jgi:hypothetical protein
MNTYKNGVIRSPYNKTQREHFFMVDNDYIKYYARHLGRTATAVYMSLLMHADYDTKRCFPSMQLIAEQHGIERHTVGKAISKLEEWNMIRIERLFDRKLVKRKNYTYTLVPIEFWKKLPVEDDETNENEDRGIEDATEDDDDDLPFSVFVSDDIKKSYGTKNTTHMVSKIPDSGIEDSNNNTNITKTKEENSFCGEPTELPFSLSKKFQLLKNEKSKKSTLGVSKSAVWSSDQAVLSLVNNSCKDYQIIGEYFSIKKMSFNNKSAFNTAIKRSLRAAKSLKEYTIDRIKETMKWVNEYDFDYSEPGISWSLEAVSRYIDDDFETPNQSTVESKTTAFNIFWNAYPKKMDRLSAEKVFKTIDPILYPKILDSVELHKKTEQWQKAEYIPLASKWLENQRWEDEVVASSVDPMERYARELIKQFPPDNDTTAQFRFSKKYGNQNLLRFKNLFQL